jgi:L-iditol 2-dehydrogenase
MRESCKDFPYILGAFSEYCYVLPGMGIVKVPDGVKDEWASGASCAGRTVVHAFEAAGALENSETVLIQGSGPLGLFAAAVASRSGVSKVIVIGAPKQRLDVAKKWGATSIISIEEVPDPAKRVEMVMEITGGRGADVIFEMSGVTAAFPEGLDMVARGGRYVITGNISLTKSVPVRPALISSKNMRILGTWSGDVSHYYKSLQFMNNNKDRFDWDMMTTNRYKLDQVNEALIAMQQLKEIKPVIVY